MIVSCTFESSKRFDGQRLVKLLAKLSQSGWSIETGAASAAVGYLTDEAAKSHRYDFERYGSFEVDELPRSFEFLSIKMLAGIESRDAFHVDLILDNTAGIVGFDIDSDQILSPALEEERLNMQRVAHLGVGLWKMVGPCRGIIGVEIDAHSEAAGLDWTYWPKGSLEQANQQGLAELRCSAYLILDVEGVGSFIAATPLLQPPLGDEYERTTKLLRCTFGE